MGSLSAALNDSSFDDGPSPSPSPTPAPSPAAAPQITVNRSKTTPGNAAVTITPDPPPVTITPDAPQGSTLMIAPNGGEAAYVPQNQVADYQAKGAKPGVLMIAPTRETAYVPTDKVAENEARGAEVGIRMTGPDGSKAVIPFSKQDINQKKGAKWDVHPDNDAAKAFLARRSDSLGRTNANMTAAMSGQPMSTPEDQAQFEAGRQEGTIAGAATIAGGAATGAVSALTAPSVMSETVGTGILDTAGEEIMREGIKYGPSTLAKALSHPVGREILGWAVKGGASAVGGGAVWKALKILGVF